MASASPVSDAAPLAASPLTPSADIAFALPDADRISVRGARVHNLRNVDLDVPRDALVVITGLSGSGKSSLAFDTIYAEGQRRFMESLSAYARQFLGMMERPDVDHVDGLSPVIAIEQKTVSRNPRSTVGTVTEIYDFLRLLYARAGEAFSYTTGAPMRKQSDDEIIDAIAGLPEGTKVILLAPVIKGRKGHYRELFEQIARQGFERVRVDGELREIKDGMKLDRYKTHDIEVVVDRLVIRPDPPRVEGADEDGDEPETGTMRSRVAASVETALSLGEGACIAHLPEGTPGPIGVAATKAAARDILLSRHLVDPESGLSYDEPSPNTFSFNSPYGACPLCDGLGSRRALDPSLIVPDASKSIARGALVPLGKPRDVWIFSQLKAVADTLGFTFETAIDDLDAAQRRVLMEGAGDTPFAVTYKYKGREVTYEHRFTGIFGHIQHTFDNATAPSQRKWAEAFMRPLPCAACHGGRLKPEALSYRVGGKNIADLVQMDLTALRAFFETLSFGESGGDGAGRRTGGAHDAAGSDRGAHRQGDPRAPRLHDRRRRRVPHARPRRADALRRRVAAHPPRHADRHAAHRRPLRLGRTVDRPAPARQRAPDRQPPPPARPRQLGARRRARPRDDRGGRPRRRHGTGRGRTRRPHRRRRPAGRARSRRRPGRHAAREPDARLPRRHAPRARCRRGVWRDRANRSCSPARPATTCAATPSPCPSARSPPSPACRGAASRAW